MPHIDDPIHRLLEWEAEARRVVDEATVQAHAIRDEAQRRRQERLARAREEAARAAEQRRTSLLDEAEPLCLAKKEEARQRAAEIRELAGPHLDDAAEAAWRWLFLYEEVTHVRRSSIR